MIVVNMVLKQTEPKLLFYNLQSSNHSQEWKNIHVFYPYPLKSHLWKSGFNNLIISGFLKKQNVNSSSIGKILVDSNWTLAQI